MVKKYLGYIFIETCEDHRHPRPLKAPDELLTCRAAKFYTRLKYIKYGL